MMLWHKILIVCLALYTLTFSVSAAVFITQNHIANIDQETRRGFSDQALINERFASGLQALGSAGLENPQPLIERYSEYYALRQIELALYHRESRLFYGSIDGAGLDPQLLHLLTSQQKARISSGKDDTGQTRYTLYVSGELLGYPEYLLLYVRDITDLYSQRSQMIRTFLAIAAAMIVLLGLAAYILARHLTRPLRRLGQAASEIADGHYQVLMTNSKDETARLVESFNKMTEAIQLREHNLEQAANDRQLFIDNLTHEISTPLTAIQGYAELLQNEKINETQRNIAASTIRREAVRLHELQDKLLKLILIRKDDIDLQTICLRSFFDHLASVMTMQLQTRSVELVIECLTDYVTADPDLLEVLLSNLIRNSLQASDPGRKIRVTAKAKGEAVQISVIDQGCGIASDMLERVFQPFGRTDASRSRKTGGAGLGLALCQEIASRHQGFLTIDSTPGQGTTVHLMLPGQSPVSQPETANPLDILQL